MTSKLRFPPLAVPFAALGGAAGWLWCSVLHAAHTGSDLAPRERLAPAGVALVGGLAGALLGPSRPTEEWLLPRPSAGRVTAVVLTAGLLAGLIVTKLVAQDALWLRAVTGALCAVALLPACLLVIAARRRADQARPGSIVARAERRAVYSLLAAGLATLAALTLPDWIEATEGLTNPPRDALLLAAIAAAIGISALLADLVASWRAGRLDAQLALGDGPATSVDFGLGNDVASRAEPGTAYRGGGRTVTMTVGDPALARATLQRSLARGAAVVAFIELVALGHGIARDPVASAAYQAELCERGRTRICRKAALLSERAGQPDAQSTRLHQIACDDGDEQSCRAVYLLGRRADASR